MSAIHRTPLLAALALTVPGGAAFAEAEAGPAAMRERHAAAVEAFNAHALAAMVEEFYAEDARLHDPQAPGPIEGHEAILASYEAMVESFPDIRVEILGREASGTALWYELRLVGTNDGPLATPQGALPATGAAIDLPSVVVAEPGPDGRFAEVRRYYDTGALMRQLGLGD